MNTPKAFCPNEVCSARGQRGQGNIRNQDRKRQRYRCTVCQKQIRPAVHIGTVIKRTEKKPVVEITRKIAHGLLEQAEKLLHSSRGGMVLNTAFFDRLNGTFRERLASLARNLVKPLVASKLWRWTCIRLDAPTISVLRAMS